MQCDVYVVYHLETAIHKNLDKARRQASLSFSQNVALPTRDKSQNGYPHSWVKGPFGNCLDRTSDL